MGALVSDSLLPINATPLELAIEAATCVPLPIYNQTLWDPMLCPEHLLPWLAHSLSVDVWEPSWPESTKRQVIATSVRVHRIKGTRAAIRVALEAAGFGQSTIVEGFRSVLHDGSISYDGAQTHATATPWAEYSVHLARPITLGQAEQVRRILSAVQPVRCQLRALDYREVAVLYDGAITYNGTYSHGVA